MRSAAQREAARLTLRFGEGLRLFYFVFAHVYEIDSAAPSPGATVRNGATDMTMHKLYIYNSCENPLTVLGETHFAKDAGY